MTNDVQVVVETKEPWIEKGLFAYQVRRTPSLHKPRMDVYYTGKIIRGKSQMEHGIIRLRAKFTAEIR